MTRSASQLAALPTTASSARDAEHDCSDTIRWINHTVAIKCIPASNGTFQIYHSAPSGDWFLQCVVTGEELIPLFTGLHERAQLRDEAQVAYSAYYRRRAIGVTEQETLDILDSIDFGLSGL
jgi:hypothetical protein